MRGNNKKWFTMFISFVGVTSTSVLLNLPTLAMPNFSDSSIEISEASPSNSRLYSQNNGTTTTPGTTNEGTTTTPGTTNDGTTTTPGTINDGTTTTPGTRNEGTNATPGTGGRQNNGNIRALW
ncbi:hypothetical protein B4U84_14720 [Westiellopsis prolifica IICB1]|nr:hypothetical protein B4U84_14720 [Westiellopsis prolifica IICB1]